MPRIIPPVPKITHSTIERIVNAGYVLSMVDGEMICEPVPSKDQAEFLKNNKYAIIREWDKKHAAFTYTDPEGHEGLLQYPYGGATIRYVYEECLELIGRCEVHVYSHKSFGFIPMASG